MEDDIMQKTSWPIKYRFLSEDEIQEVLVQHERWAEHRDGELKKLTCSVAAVFVTLLILAPLALWFWLGLFVNDRLGFAQALALLLAPVLIAIIRRVTKGFLAMDELKD